MYVVFSVWFFDVLWLAVVFAAVLVVSCGIRAADPGTLGGAWARNRRDHTDPETQRHLTELLQHTVMKTVR